MTTSSSTPSGAGVAPTEIPEVVACIPLYEMNYSVFTQTFIQSIRGAAGVLMQKATYIQDNFNQIVQQALTQHPNAQFLFFLEQDMTLPEGIVGALAREYASREPAIYGGIYFGRSVDDQRPIPGRFNEKAHALTRLPGEDLDPLMQKPGLYPMDAVGTGCTFVHRDVFEKWDRNHPAFSEPSHTAQFCAAHMLDEEPPDPGFKGPWFATPPGPDPIAVMSQDVWFCWHAGVQGFPVYLDTRLQAEHKGIVSFGYSSHLAWRRQLELMEARAKAAENQAPVLSPALQRAVSRKTTRTHKRSKR